MEPEARLTGTLNRFGTRQEGIRDTGEATRLGPPGLHHPHTKGEALPTVLPNFFLLRPLLSSHLPTYLTSQPLLLLPSHLHHFLSPLPFFSFLSLLFSPPLSAIHSSPFLPFPPFLPYLAGSVQRAEVHMWEPQELILSTTWSPSTCQSDSKKERSKQGGACSFQCGLTPTPIWKVPHTNSP